MTNLKSSSLNNRAVKLLIITAAFITLVNVTVLTGVGKNRSGEPLASLKLSERELALPYRSKRNKENSGLALRVKWNLVPTWPYTSSYSRYILQNHSKPSWLTKEKLQALGIDVNDNKSVNEYSKSSYGRAIKEELIIVLEFNGDTYKTAVKKAEEDIKHYRNSASVNPDDEKLAKKLKRYEKSLENLKNKQSRLFAVDVGNNIQTLKQQYNEKSKYLFLRSEIRRNWYKNKFNARIKQIFNDRVHVGLPESGVIGERVNKNQNTKDKVKYEVELLLGERLEVWVGGVLSKGILPPLVK